MIQILRASDPHHEHLQNTQFSRHSQWAWVKTTPKLNQVLKTRSTIESLESVTRSVVSSDILTHPQGIHRSVAVPRTKNQFQEQDAQAPHVVAAVVPVVRTGCKTHSSQQQLIKKTCWESAALGNRKILQEVRDPSLATSSSIIFSAAMDGRYATVK